MNCEINTSLYFVNRLRIIDGEPYTIEYSYYNKDIKPYLSEDIDKKSKYTYITDDLKLNIGFADKVIYADKLNKQSSKLFNLEENNPDLVMDDTVFLSNGDIFEVSIAIHNY